MPFRFQRLEIPQVVLVQARKFEDERGLFAETFKKSEFSTQSIGQPFVQDNFSHSGHGVLRGLHYQKHPQAQAKLVMTLRGQIFDVAVDIRKGSPTYGKWVGAILSDENLCMLYIPVGFAHGFCVLSEQADVIYKVTQEYAPELDRGIIWNDPEIGVQWPVTEPDLSPKDAQLPLLSQADNNFNFMEETYGDDDL